VKYSIACAIAAAALVAGVASAQPLALSPTPPVLDLQAQGISGERFNIEKIRGKVAIVFFWSTACPVCRDSLPELRANLAGWRNKPFALVTVNVDRRASDWIAYERILSQLQQPPNGLIALRQDEGKPQLTKLPLTLLIDAQGKIVSRYEGRMAPEAWDAVADLLP
jgi:cytochrome oxidase Cu insertion factor (SCO1/SenC/PrrC family)